MHSNHAQFHDECDYYHGDKNRDGHGISQHADDFRFRFWFHVRLPRSLVNIAYHELVWITEPFGPKSKHDLPELVEQELLEVLFLFFYLDQFQAPNNFNRNVAPNSSAGNARMFNSTCAHVMIAIFLVFV